MKRLAKKFNQIYFLLSILVFYVLFSRVQRIISLILLFLRWSFILKIFSIVALSFESGFIRFSDIRGFWFNMMFVDLIIIYILWLCSQSFSIIFPLRHNFIWNCVLFFLDFLLLFDIDCFIGIWKRFLSFHF